MTDVKRYTLVNGLLHHPRATMQQSLEYHERFTGEKQIVLATDYDVLAARNALLEAEIVEWKGHSVFRERDALAAELADIRGKLIGPMNDWTWGKLFDWMNERNTRIATLEAALREANVLFEHLRNTDGFPRCCAADFSDKVKKLAAIAPKEPPDE